MKQVWVGIGLLAALLLGGIWVGKSLEQAHSKQILDLSHASDAARDENWTRAEAYLTRVTKEWESQRGLQAALHRHDPLEQIDGLFAQLKAQLNCRDREGFCANCALLEKCLENLPQSHCFRWRNLL